MQGRVVSAFLGAPGVLSKAEQTELEFALDGIVGDRHRGLSRRAWDLTDKQPGGTERRNERQWSAVAQEDLNRVAKVFPLVLLQLLLLLDSLLVLDLLLRLRQARVVVV